MKNFIKRFNKRWIYGALILSILYVIQFFYFDYYSWEAIFYRYGNGGYGPRNQGHYASKESCVEASKVILREKTMNIDGKPADEFFCGRKCSFFFLGSINTITCAGSDDPPRFFEPGRD
jgi:hypothetical protein